MREPDRIEIPMNQITEGTNVRDDLGDLTELESLVREHGVLVPVGVRKLGENSYKLEYGFRRYTCALRLGLSTIPAVLVPEGFNSLLANLIENMGRKTLNPVEEAEGFRQLELQLEIGPEALAEMVGRSEANVRHRLSLLGLTQEVKTAVAAGDLGVSNAQELARLPEDLQQRWLKRAKRLSHKALKSEVDFQLMTPAEQEQLGARELARLAGAEDPPEPTLPGITETVEDPRQLMAREYARRSLDYVMTVWRMWAELPESLKADCREAFAQTQTMVRSMMEESANVH